MFYRWSDTFVVVDSANSFGFTRLRLRTRLHVVTRLRFAHRYVRVYAFAFTLRVYVWLRLRFAVYAFAVTFTRTVDVGLPVTPFHHTRVYGYVPPRLFDSALHTAVYVAHGSRITVLRLPVTHLPVGLHAFTRTFAVYTPLHAVYTHGYTLRTVAVTCGYGYHVTFCTFCGLRSGCVYGLLPPVYAFTPLLHYHTFGYVTVGSGLVGFATCGWFFTTTYLPVHRIPFFGWLVRGLPAFTFTVAATHHVVGSARFAVGYAHGSCAARLRTTPHCVYFITYRRF